MKQDRLQRIQKKIQLQSKTVSQHMLGSTQRILIEGISKKNHGELCGRTDNNRMVNFSGDASEIGNFIDVVITAALSHSLRGEIVRSAHIGLSSI